MILSDENLTHLIKDGMITNVIDISTQITPNGIDLTLQKIETFTDKGIIDFTNENRKLPPTKEIPFVDNSIHVNKGSYKVTFNEIVTIPDNMVALARPRSSLLRSGATIESAVWDAGFHGISISLLVVYNPYGITLQKNARLLQLFFVKLSEKARKGYQGVYQSKKAE
ncbi:MAG: deoxyuridine 5'-triphosphate nucleotidohydrolase [Candidatus Methanofastidiosia archaeon]|jgi:dUTP pyrophosphatase